MFRCWCGDYHQLLAKICGLLQWMQIGCADRMCRFDVVHCTKKAHQIKMQICMQICMQIFGEFHCTSNLHSNAADGLLHIQSAHRKLKCNRPYIAAFDVGICKILIIDCHTRMKAEIVWHVLCCVSRVCHFHLMASKVLFLCFWRHHHFF
jgi:hypothetical protein